MSYCAESPKSAHVTSSRTSPSLLSSLLSLFFLLSLCPGAPWRAQKDKSFVLHNYEKNALIWQFVHSCEGNRSHCTKSYSVLLHDHSYCNTK